MPMEFLKNDRVQLTETGINHITGRGRRNRIDPGIRGTVTATSTASALMVFVLWDGFTRPECYSKRYIEKA